VRRARDELARRGLIELYSARGAVYARITGWDDDASPMFQRVEARKDPKFPTPAEGEILRVSAKSSGTRRRRTPGVVGEDSPLDWDQDQDQDQEGKGKGKGKGTGAAAGAAADSASEEPHRSGVSPVSDPDRRQIKASFETLYCNAYGRAYVWTSANEKQLTGLLKLLGGGDEILRRAEIMITYGDRRAFPKPPYSFGTLSSHVNEFGDPPPIAKNNGAAGAVRATADGTGYGTDV
jgi:hypothetical protein